MARPERSILIIGALVLVLVVAAIVTALAFGPGGQANFPADSPERALQEYLTALKDGDIERAYAIVSQSAKNQMSSQGTPNKDDFGRMVSGSRGDADNRRVRISQVERNANDQTATITIEVEYFSGSGIDFNRSSWTRPIRMVREDGNWKVDEPFFSGAIQPAPFALSGPGMDTGTSAQSWPRWL